MRWFSIFIGVRASVVRESGNLYAISNLMTYDSSASLDSWIPFQYCLRRFTTEIVLPQVWTESHKNRNIVGFLTVVVAGCWRPVALTLQSSHSATSTCLFGSHASCHVFLPSPCWALKPNDLQPCTLWIDEQADDLMASMVGDVLTIHEQPSW